MKCNRKNLNRIHDCVIGVGIRILNIVSIDLTTYFS